MSLQAAQIVQGVAASGTQPAGPAEPLDGVRGASTGPGSVLIVAQDSQPAPSKRHRPLAPLTPPCSVGRAGLAFGARGHDDDSRRASMLT